MVLRIRKGTPSTGVGRSDIITKKEFWMMKKGFLIPLGCLLAGCSLFPESDPPLPLYTLKSAPLRPTSALADPLAIDLPLSELSLDTQRIAITPALYQRDYLANGQWPDRLPKVVEEILVESLSERWGGDHVNRNSTGLQATYVLFSEIQDFSFYPGARGTPEVRLKIMFKVIDFPKRQALAARTFCEKVSVPSVSMHAIVCAFNQGLHTLLQKALPWMETVFSEKPSRREEPRRQRKT